MTDPYRELLPFYVNGTLAPGQRAALEEHLRGCEGCRAEVEEWSGITAKLQSPASTMLNSGVAAQLQVSTMLNSGVAGQLQDAELPNSAAAAQLQEAELPNSGTAGQLREAELPNSAAQLHSAVTGLHNSAGQLREKAAGLQFPAAEADRLPPLSPVVRLSLQRQPHGRRDLRQALVEAAALVAAQRLILRQALLVPALAAAVLLAVLGTLLLPRATGDVAGLPFVVIVPILAVLVVTYLYTFDQPRTYEMVAVTPTAPNALLWARLTLLLGTITGMAFAGSLVVALLDGGQLFTLVGAWLGPMLWLSALSTLLSLLWRPYAASGLALAGWVGLLLVLAQGGREPAEAGSLLRGLLSPGWGLLAAELALAGLLWLACWRLLRGGVPPALRMEER